MTISFRVDNSAFKSIVEIAKSQDLRVSQILRKLLKNYIEENRKK